MPLIDLFNRRSIRSILRSVTRYWWGRSGSGRILGWRLIYRIRIQVVLRKTYRVQKFLKERNRVRAWIDGEEAFPRIEKLLRKAKHTIVIRMFIWKDDTTGRQLAREVLRAADRGVRTEIVKDSTGDAFELYRDFLSTSKEQKEPWRRFWNHRNITIQYASNRDHSKVFLIDDDLILLGGMNIANEYRRGWHDYLIELKGKEFVEHFLTEGEVRGGDPTVRLVLNAGSKYEVRPVLTGILKRAKESIFIVHCYISDVKVIDLLARKTQEGVKVTIIVPERKDVYQQATERGIHMLLSKANHRKLQILLYPGVVHGKLILVDRSTVFTGSANLMSSSIDRMGEANVLIRGGHARALFKLRESIRRDISVSHPLLSPPQLRWFGKALAWMGV